MIRKAIKSLRTKNNQNFGYKLVDENITNEIEFNSKITFLNSDGSEMSSNPITWSDVNAEKSLLETAKINEQAQKEADALAGNNKLLELGLTQAQVTAMTGYTPPAN